MFNGKAHTALRTLVESGQVAPDEAQRQRARMAERVLAESPTLKRHNFDEIANRDVARMLAAVDEACFAKGLHACIAERGAVLAACASSRMTSAGGKTVVGKPRHGGAWHIEVRLAVTPLFRSFRDDEPTGEREINVNGVRCEDRLTAALAVVEHEAMHVAEFLCYGTSACHKPPFQEAARRLFGHESHKHQLVSSWERAHVAFGLTPGCRVRFTFQGKPYEGIVNRVVKRATVLVPDPNGMPFSDGQTYTKFYVPLGALERLEDDT